VEADRALRTDSEKFSTHVSIVIPVCNSVLSGIPASWWVWNLTQSVRLKSGRTGGYWKAERHVVLMRTGRCSELSAGHEARCTKEGLSLVITMTKTSGVAVGLNGLVVGLSGPKISHGFLSA
jgi:hypothetical protein